MSEEQVYVFPDIAMPSRPVVFTDKCKGCNLCVEVCLVDVYIRNSEKGKPHQSYCIPRSAGIPVAVLTHAIFPGAIEFYWPLQLRGYWKLKDTGRRSHV